MLPLFTRAFTKRSRLPRALAATGLACTALYASCQQADTCKWLQIGLAVRTVRMRVNIVNSTRCGQQCLHWHVEPRWSWPVVSGCKSAHLLVLTGAAYGCIVPVNAAKDAPYEHSLRVRLCVQPRMPRMSKIAYGAATDAYGCSLRVQCSKY